MIGAEFVARDPDLIAWKPGRTLGKFASAIERITVRLSDANGPERGRDRIAQINVMISGKGKRGGGDRAIEAAALALREALNAAA